MFRNTTITASKDEIESELSGLEEEEEDEEGYDLNDPEDKGEDD